MKYREHETVNNCILNAPYDLNNPHLDLTYNWFKIKEEKG